MENKAKPKVKKKRGREKRKERTSLRLNEVLLQITKHEANRKKQQLTEAVEQGMMLWVARSQREPVWIDEARFLISRYTGDEIQNHLKSLLILFLYDRMPEEVKAKIPLDFRDLMMIDFMKRYAVAFRHSYAGERVVEMLGGPSPSLTPQEPRSSALPTGETHAGS